MKRCNRCVTPESYPGTSFNTDGVCNHCLNYQKEYKDWESGEAERKKYFERILKSAKKRSTTYDALVPLSGGKDSTYILYLATKVFGLRVLSYTFDNGFQSDIAKENISAAIDASGSDHFVFKPNPTMLMNLYRHFLEHTGMFCPVCMRGITAGSFFVARQFNIPLVLSGTSKRTEERLVPEIFQDGEISFFRNVLKRHPFPGDVRVLFYDRTLMETMERIIFLLSKGQTLFGRTYVYVPDYFDWNYKKIYETIGKEMGWKTTPDHDEHMDCIAEPIVNYFVRESRVPELTPSTLQYSAKIRVGQLSRNEALEVVQREFAERSVPHETTYFLKKLVISEDDLKKYMIDGHRHMEFQNQNILRKAYSLLRSKGFVR